MGSASTSTSPPPPPSVPAQKKVRTRAAPSGLPTYRIKTRFSNKTRKYKVAKSPDQLTAPKPPSRPSTSQGQLAPQDDEACILVMGPSGAGKTSFINLASDSHLPVSSGLGSCTSAVTMSEPFQLDGEQVRLIDTPGFDDSGRSDGDVLAIIADFLAKEFSKGKRLRSILYFHRISDVRMGALAKKNFVMFQNMVGEQAYANVVVVTTRWNEVNTLVAEERETELRTNAAFFQPIVEAGGLLMRYARTTECTQRIVRQALTCTPAELSIQRQMMVEKKKVVDTDAGTRLQVEKLDHIEKCKGALKDLVQEIEVLRAGNDTDGLKGLEGDVRMLRERVRALQEENLCLLSRTDSWELVPKPVSEEYEEEDAEPRMIGALPLENGGGSWREWLARLFAVLFN